jgi:hypothetical protein
MPNNVARVSDLADVTRQWSMRWWDPAEHMVWNPPGSFDDETPPQTLHLVPNTAWCAYALLAADERDEGVAALRALLAVQYDAPGRVWDGTFRRFLEMPEPPDDAVMWVHYDPNWRQFVGTTFALIVEDFGDRLEPALIDQLVASIGRACAGEPDRRIPPSYTNPALMRAWLDAWYGARVNDAHYVDRGLAFAARLAAEFDEFGAFDEFNSPTYYGIDLYALRLWQQCAPDPLFAREGARLEDGLWVSAAAFYNANLRNFCGPYTRSYGADARRSVSLFSLWIWAVLGREFAPLPDLDAPSVDHGHDLMAGPVFARLAPSSVPDAFRRFAGTHTVRQALPRGRVVTSWIAPNVMLGAESSAVDWGGWSQFMPVTAHWGSGEQLAVLWLVDPHVVDARASERGLDINIPNATHATFELRSDEPIEWRTDGFVTCGRRVEAAGVVRDGARFTVPLNNGAVSLRFTDAAS